MPKTKPKVQVAVGLSADSNGRVWLSINTPDLKKAGLKIGDKVQLSLLSDVILMAKMEIKPGKEKSRTTGIVTILEARGSFGSRARLRWTPVDFRFYKHPSRQAVAWVTANGEIKIGVPETFKSWKTGPKSLAQNNLKKLSMRNNNTTKLRDAVSVINHAITRNVAKATIHNGRLKVTVTTTETIE